MDKRPSLEPGQEPCIGITFPWPAFVALEAGTALGCCRDILSYLGTSYRTIGGAYLRGHWGRRMAARYKEAGIPFVEHFDDVCRKADLYITDNSSTLFEFAATGRPVVVLNSPEWRRNVNHGLRFWDAANVGINVDRAKDLIGAVARALDDPPQVQMEREKALSIVYAHRSGAAERAARVIEDSA